LPAGDLCIKLRVELKVETLISANLLDLHSRRCLPGRATAGIAGIEDEDEFEDDYD
jgi:hypothetical protein